MQSEINFFEGIQRILSLHNILSISGESGTGKTTLALQLIGKFLTYKEPYTSSCIWIQASDQFTLKRLTHIFEDNPKELEYITKNIYIIPKKKPVHNYEEQSSTIQKIINPTTIIPPFLKYIVIDNISHHLRYKLTQYSTPKHALSLLDSFYETQLMPLLLFCKRNKIILIMIHEYTYSPSLQKSKPFFYKLYDRINTIDMILNNVYNSDKKNLHVIFNMLNWHFQYVLEHRGIKII
ncbi:MAG: NB-ARC domain-containing protein [Promethearchaeota archaeon]